MVPLMALLMVHWMDFEMAMLTMTGPCYDTLRVSLMVLLYDMLRGS